MDFISSLPDVILHHILSFIPTNLAIRTSLFSRRWRHVWCETPCLYFDDLIYTATLGYYTAPNMMNFHLRINHDYSTPQINSLIELAMSRNVQKLFIDFEHSSGLLRGYHFPESFYLSSSLKQLSVRLKRPTMIPACTVSWKSLRKLSLSYCNLPDESVANILSGCPKLKSLTLIRCRQLKRLDLSKSPSLTKLEIDCDGGPTEIIAPHIHYLRLTNSLKPCTLLDVSSVTEANLEIWENTFKAASLQTTVPKMLAKLHNVERLTIGTTFLQILSLSELRGVPFPMLDVQTLIVDTALVRYVVPAIARLLQNSPGLKKLIVHTMPISYIQVKDIKSCLNSQGFNPDQCWGSKYEVFPHSWETIRSMLYCKDTMSKLLASLIELLVRNAKTLETIVVRLGRIFFEDAKWFEEQLQMVQTLSHSTNVSIVLKPSAYY